MASLPAEVLLDILKFCLVDRMTTVEPCDAAGRGSRNELLLNTSLVSKAWADVSQYLLFRDIHVGSVTTTKDGAGSKIRETLSSGAMLDALRRLSDRGHVRSAHLPIGTGFAYCTQQGQAVVPRYTGSRATTWRLPIVSLKWLSPRQLADFLDLCPNLHHLALTVADPSGDMRNQNRSRPLTEPIAATRIATLRSLNHLQTLSFTFKTESSPVRFGEPIFILAQILAIAPNIVSLFVDVYPGGGGEYHSVSKLAPVELPQLRELRISNGLPSFIIRGRLPALESVVWRKPDHTQVNSLPPTVRTLFLGGDFYQGIPNFRRLPNLRHYLIDGCDFWEGSSYWDDSYRQTGIANKNLYIKRTIEALPRGLETFTIFESLSMRLLPRDSLCSTISSALSNKGDCLPHTLKVQRASGELPSHFTQREWGSSLPLYEDPEFVHIRRTMESRNVQLVTGETSDPFSDLFRMSGVHA